MKKRDNQLLYMEEQLTLEKDAFIVENTKNNEIKKQTDTLLTDLRNQLK